MSQPSIEEARRIVALDDCHNHGHSWDILTNFSGQPVRIVCRRCAEWYPIADKRYEEQP